MAIGMRCLTSESVFDAASYKGGVMPGHSRPKDGVAALAYDPGIHPMERRTLALRKTSAAEPRSWIAGSSPAMTAECVSRVREKSLQLLLQKPHQPRREETGKTVRLIDRIAAPVMRCALQDRGAHKEAGLLQRQHERVGVRRSIHEVVLGADAAMHRDLVVGAHRMTDR